MLLESWQLAALIFFSLVLLHLCIAPYTKVEESFNIQAVHDILSYGIPTQNVVRRFKAQFDHMEFPGAVPRTFLGALMLSGVAKPFVYLFRLSLQNQQYLGMPPNQTTISYLITHFESSACHTRPVQCIRSTVLYQWRQGSIRQHHRALVYFVSSWPIPCLLLRFADSTQYVRILSEYVVDPDVVLALTVRQVQ
jgi:hypothetical protein